MKKLKEKEKLPPLRSPDLAHDRFYRSRLPVIYRRDVFESELVQAKHLHDFPQIWYCLSGECLHTVGDATFDMKKGDLVIVPPGASHSFRGKDTAELLSISISAEAFLDVDIKEIYELAFFTLLPAFSEEATEKLSTRKIRLSEESQDKLTSLFSKLSLGSHSLRELLIETNKIFLLPEFSLSEEEKEAAHKLLTKKVIPIIKAVRFINENFSEKITTEKLVSASLLCQTSFFSFFKTLLGMRASYYIQRVRVSNAVLYLAHSAYDIAAISDFCGFNSPSHLVLCHKKQTGLLPKYFRARLKEFYDKNPEFKKNIKF